MMRVGRLGCCVVMQFHPNGRLLPGEADARCQVCVVVPARNEAEHLAASMGALGRQIDAEGRSVAPETFEVVLLLNNCSDSSAAVARQVAQTLRDRVRLHIVERELPRKLAHVGTARRLLMDTAWARLQGRRHGAILSTDADTTVSETWVAENLRALERADVVGGEICWAPGELERLPAGVRQAYERDMRLQRMVAEMEHWLDPLPEDPWPRHRHCFGASLGCTPEIYARVGGLPVKKSLEDMAFVQLARACGARVRHEPRVRVFTSGRMEGRVEVGLSGQLRQWHAMANSGGRHLVPSAEWMVFRARWAGLVRRYAVSGAVEDLREMPKDWAAALQAMRAEERTTDLVERFEGWISGAFGGEREGEIGEVLRVLEGTLADLRREAARGPEDELVGAGVGVRERKSGLIGGETSGVAARPGGSAPDVRSG